MSLTISDRLRQSFPHLNINDLQAVYVGSESHPYAVKPTGTLIAELFGIDQLTSADLEFACKAGTAGIQIIAAQVASGMIKAGLAIGADIAQAMPGDALEFTAGAGGAGFVLSNQKSSVIAKLLTTTSYTTNTPDFWRRELQAYPVHTGRFTGPQAYLKHVSQVITTLLTKTDYQAADFDHVVLHSPNLKFPDQIAQQFGFKAESLIHRHLFPQIGNAYAGSTMLGLAYALEHAQPQELILVVAYGSGAGADGLIFQTTNLINKSRPKLSLKIQLDRRQEIDYLKYKYLVSSS